MKQKKLRKQGKAVGTPRDHDGFYHNLFGNPKMVAQLMRDCLGPCSRSSISTKWSA